MQPANTTSSGYMMAIYPAEQKPQQKKMEEKAQEQAQMLCLWAALTMSMAPWAYTYPWTYTGVTWRK